VVLSPIGKVELTAFAAWHPPAVRRPTLDQALETALSVLCGWRPQAIAAYGYARDGLGLCLTMSSIARGADNELEGLKFGMSLTNRTDPSFTFL